MSARIQLLLALLLVAFIPARSQSGVLVPKDKDQPDPAVLSLEEMNVEIVIDNGDARIFVTQIFANHTNQVEEGNYTFALPTGSTVSDFAVWDGPVRIPAVILERKRAEEIYSEARAQAIDPGLLEAGERDGSDPKADSTFTAHITPIPAYGTKRLELEYHQKLKVDRLGQSFVLPLKPADAAQQTAAHLRIHIELHSSIAISNFHLTNQAFPLQFSKQDAHTVVGVWQSNNVTFTDDLAATWTLDPKAADTLIVSTFRNPHPPLPSATERSPKPPQPEPGFFLAQTLIAPEPPATTHASEPRNVILLLDTSLSMQWDKLERSYAALETVLRSLQPTDRFSLMLFNQDLSWFRPDPTQATPESVQEALQFIRASRLRGGTDLGKALAAALTQAKSPNQSLYLFTDGNSDRGVTILDNKIAAAYTQQWNHSTHPRTNVFAIGDDANLPLLRLLARNDGLFENVLTTEPLQPKLDVFLAHSVSHPTPGLHLEAAPSASVQNVYPLDEAVYPGSLAAWVGRYLTPTKHVTFTAQADREGKPLIASATLDLPAESLEHPQLPRLWAQARVNILLDQITREGESRAAIDEIIELSRRYKFVTPYTSFLAAPRSLLRPRVIRPGDPVLRIHTDPTITSVIALFPFGLTKPLRHLPSEDTTKGPDSDRLWETRFLAPTDMSDGTYQVRLILRDVRGNTYSEQKSFVINSTPPTIRIKLERIRFHRGEIMLVKAGAPASTQTLTAHLEGAAPVDLRWNNAAAANTGQLRIPDTMAPGTYTLSVTGEDLAHNVGSQEVRIEVIP
ncbi:VIT domain-containing protein [Granulicella tundricola]|uniref:von Willebrand factor type A n=1 Tax=Granulicella tundricola (strain ATCC BAA-1859 / DSM 23138 / MP5ACTX9) TaxID=1198114 RepID=E8WWD4_GRATM|nr:VIT domain-containing protein [Granulicella tundricola]ADW68517.1 von Willebrand factor type A [Granulicella tundricola MP5ACTX9]